MNKFIINGQNRLVGDVKISGAKNAAVAILPATILANDICIIENVPDISDVAEMAYILQEMGAKIRLINRSTYEIDTRNIFSHVANYDSVRRMRASSYLLGSLLGRFSCAEVSLPGGCNFGVRPIDQHLKGFSALGAEHSINNGSICVKADTLVGNRIYLDVVSVGATVNIILAAVKARGKTIIENAAREPHIVDLANFLNSMGAQIMGAGTDVIKIKGVSELHGTTYSIIPDQIEAGTYMAATAITGGDVTLLDVIPKHLESISAKFREMGIIVTEYDDSIRVISSGTVRKCNVKTMPYPGFPTDMQPQIVALLATAQGTSIINENVWDNRFKYVDELKRMGAQISVDGKIAVVEGIDELCGAPVTASDLRAGAALVIAGLAAKGQTEIDNIEYIERGYESIVKKLTDLGADIRKAYVPSHISMQEAL